MPGLSFIDSEITQNGATENAGVENVAPDVRGGKRGGKSDSDQ